MALDTPPPSLAEQDVPPRLPTAGAAARVTFGSFYFSCQPLLLSALMLPATAYIIRGLGPTNFGQFATAATVVATTTCLTNLGLRGTFVRTVAREPETRGQALAEQLGARLSLAVLAALAAITGCRLLHYPHTVLLCTLVGVLGMLINTVTTTAIDLLQALQRFPLVANTNMISGITSIGAAILLTWYGAGPVALSSAYLAGPLVGAVLLCTLISRRHCAVRLTWHPRRVGGLLWHARFFATQQLASTATQNVTALTVASLLGPTTFGFFSAGSLLADRLSALPDGLGVVAYPAVADAPRHGPGRIIRTVAHFLLVMLLVCLPAAAAVSLLAGPIAQLLFPGRSAVCQQVIRITIWLLPLVGIESILGYTLNALHKDAAQARAALWGMGHVMVAAWLVWQFGLVGACWAMVLRAVIRLAVIMPCLVRTFRPLFQAWRQDAAPLNNTPIYYRAPA